MSDTTAEQTENRAGKKALTIEEEIVKATERLKALQEKKRLADKRERERNHRAVLDFLAKEKLDHVPAEKWLSALPQLKVLLLTENTPKPKSEKKERVEKAAEAIIKDDMQPKAELAQSV